MLANQIIAEEAALMSGNLVCMFHKANSITGMMCHVLGNCVIYASMTFKSAQNIRELSSETICFSDRNVFAFEYECYFKQIK